MKKKIHRHLMILKCCVTYVRRLRLLLHSNPVATLLYAQVAMLFVLLVVFVLF